MQDRQLLQEIHYWKRLNSSGWMKVCQSKCNLSGAFHVHERRWGERGEKMTHSSWLMSNCSGHAKRLMKSQDWTPDCSLTPSNLPPSDWPRVWDSALVTNWLTVSSMLILARSIQMDHRKTFYRPNNFRLLNCFFNCFPICSHKRKWKQYIIYSNNAHYFNIVSNVCGLGFIFRTMLLHNLQFKPFGLGCSVVW